MEDGSITLIGATTENPSFELNASLLSRARVLVFRPLEREALEALLERAERSMGKPLPLDAEAREALVGMADGDGRAALTLAEEVWRAARAGETLRRRAARRGRAAARADLRQGAGRPLQSDLGAAQMRARLRSGRGALLSRAHVRRRRRPAVHRAAGGAHGVARTSALPTRRRSSSPTPPRTPTIFSAARRANWRSPRPWSMSRPRRNRTRSTRRSAPLRRSPKQHGSLAPPKTILNAPTRLMKREGYGADYAVRPRRARRVQRPELLAGSARPPQALRAGRARLRARDQEAARVLGAAAQGAGRG